MYAERSLERLSSANIIVLSIYTIGITHEVRLIYRESNPWGSGTNDKLYIDNHMFSPTIPFDCKWYQGVGGVEFHIVRCVNGKVLNPSLSSLGMR